MQFNYYICDECYRYVQQVVVDVFIGGVFQCQVWLGLVYVDIGGVVQQCIVQYIQFWYDIIVQKMFFFINCVDGQGIVIIDDDVGVEMLLVFYQGYLVVYFQLVWFWVVVMDFKVFLLGVVELWWYFGMCFDQGVDVFVCFGVCY